MALIALTHCGLPSLACLTQWTDVYFWLGKCVDIDWGFWFLFSLFGFLFFFVSEASHSTKSLNGIALSRHTRTHRKIFLGVALDSTLGARSTKLISTARESEKKNRIIQLESLLGSKVCVYVCYYHRIAPSKELCIKCALLQARVFEVAQVQADDINCNQNRLESEKRNRDECRTFKCKI